MMTSLVRTKATYAWLLLIALTALSWSLGTDHGLAFGGHVAASLTIVAVAVFKVRIVGLCFMEVRTAPIPLRVLFEGYCAALFGLLAVLYLIG